MSGSYTVPRLANELPAASERFYVNDLADAIDADDRALGGRGVSELFRNPDGLDAVRLGRRLVVGVLEYVGGAQQVDDQCLVVFRRKPLGENAAASEATGKAALDV